MENNGDPSVKLIRELRAENERLRNSNENTNLLLLTDSYKVSHYKQYPPNTEYLMSYFESRGGKYPTVIFFGLQYILKKWLQHPITMEMVKEADEFYKDQFATDNTKVFNREGWEYIVKEHGGKIPVLIKAVPEGTEVPVKNVLFTVESTDPKVPWVVSYFESLMVQCWYPMTVCTSSFYLKKLFKEYSEKTCDDMKKNLSAKLADFGFRGSTSVESAGIGGCANLVHFCISDNVYGNHIAQKFYSATKPPGTAAVAAEHSTMTTWGRDGEKAAVEHILTTYKDEAVSIVADSYDLWSFVENIVGKDLKELIESRSKPLIVRPDSGDPVPTLITVLNKLETSFGGVTTNAKGFKLLPPSLLVIHGDGVSPESLPKILSALEESKWSLDNVIFGSGGGLLQKMNRDTQKCAFKCCMAKINGQKVDVYKDPITDPGKTSKKGNITLVRNSKGEFETKNREEMTDNDTEALVKVFKNGVITREWTFEEIQERVDSFLF